MFKQIILPRLIQHPQFNILIPISEGPQILDKDNQKLSIVYYTIKDLIEMNLDSQNIGNTDSKTQRTLAHIEVRYSSFLEFKDS